MRTTSSREISRRGVGGIIHHPPHGSVTEQHESRPKDVRRNHHLPSRFRTVVVLRFKYSITTSFVTFNRSRGTWSISRLVLFFSSDYSAVTIEYRFSYTRTCKRKIHCVYGAWPITVTRSVDTKTVSAYTRTTISRHVTDDAYSGPAVVVSACACYCFLPDVSHAGTRRNISAANVLPASFFCTRTKRRERFLKK